MAKETIQEAYVNGVLKLEELEKLAKRSPRNGQVRRDLSGEITELRKQLIYVKQYLLKTEDLQNQADTQWQKTIVAQERAATIQKNLFDYYNLKLNFGDTPDVERLKQDIINNLKFIKGKNVEITEDDFRELARNALIEAENAKAKHTEIVKELSQLKADTLENPIWVDENRPEADRERILSEKRSQLDAEEQIQSSDEKQGTLPDETGDLNSGESYEESLEDIEKELKRTVEFKKLVAEKETRYMRIANLKGAKLIKNSPNKIINKSIRSLQKEIANREKFIKNFVYDFSQNPNYEVSDELRALIGSKDGADKNTVMQRPTVKQHLDPILKIEEELKNGVSPEREKELKAEKEKREKRLGKKWLLKLKIDKVNNRIQELIQLLSGDLSPEDKEKYQKELLNLRGELLNLQNEYAKVLAEIGEHISNAVEKSANERKAKIKSMNKDEQKVEPIKSQGKPQDNGKNSTDDKQKNDRSTMKPQTNINGAGSQRQTSDISTGAGGNIANVTNISSNLPTPKEEPIKEKVAPETLCSVAIGDDISAKQIEMREAGNFPMVNGKYFYHTIREGDELKYVREPLENISCTRKELVNKIKEVQAKYGIYYKGLYEEQKKNPLFANPNIIANKLIGFSNGLEKRQRILKAMCSLEASIHPSEAIDALNGKDTIFFRPGINGKGEFVDIRTDSYLDEGDILAQYAGKVRYKENEPNRERNKKARALIERFTKLEERLAESGSLTESAENMNLNENTKNDKSDEIIEYNNVDMNAEVNNIVPIEAVSGKITEYEKKGIPITQETYKQIVLELLADESERRAIEIENEKKADAIRAGLGAKVQESNNEELDNSKKPLARRRGRVDPRDYASSETRNRRNREGKPRSSKVVSIYDDRNAPPTPRFERHRKDKKDDVIER